MPDKNNRLERMALDPSLQPLVDRLLHVFQLSMAKAAAHLSNPGQFPMPESEQSVEHLFWRYLKKRPRQVQQRAVNQFQQILVENQEEKQSETQRVDLRSREPVQAQLKRVPLETKIDFASLFAAQVQTKSATIGKTRFSGVRLRLHQVICVDETDPEGGHDTILLGGIAYTTTRRATKLNPFFVGKFDEDDEKVKRFQPPRILNEYHFSDDDVYVTENGLEIPFGWPREYAFVFLLAEEDAGGFFEEFQEIYSKAKDIAVDYAEEEIKKLVGELTEEAIRQFATTVLASTGTGTAVGSAAPGIGNVIGAIVGVVAGLVVSLIFDLIASWLEDDLLNPQEIFLTVNSPLKFSAVGVEPLVGISGQGGLYHLLCDWEFFGEVADTQNELHVKETLGTFVSGSFVSTASDFTLLMGENSLKAAIHNWKGF
jgi:hypothetical protein